MTNPDEDVSLQAARSVSQKKVLQWMVRAFLGWLFVYMSSQGIDGFFARTVDRVDALWVQLLFLNIPLQILLMLVTSVCAGSDRPAVLRAGIWVGALNGALVLGHVILSVATA